MAKLATEAADWSSTCQVRKWPGQPKKKEGGESLRERRNACRLRAVIIIIAREFGPRNQIIKVVGMYIAVLGQLGLTDQKSVGFSERVRSNCPVGSSLKRPEIPTTSCSFVQDERKTHPEAQRVGLLFLRRKGKSEDHCRLSYITSRYQALFLSIHMIHTYTVYSRAGRDSLHVVFYHICMYVQFITYIIVTDTCDNTNHKQFYNFTNSSRHYYVCMDVWMYVCRYYVLFINYQLYSRQESRGHPT